DVVEIERILNPPGLRGIELASAVESALRIGCHGARLYQKCVSSKSVSTGSFAVILGPASDRTSRVGDPFAPRAGVQASTGEARALERQQVVASGDAGAAHGDQLLGRHTVQRVVPRASQQPGLEEAALRVEVAGEGVIACSGNVPRDRIDGLVFAAKAIGAAR